MHLKICKKCNFEFSKQVIFSEGTALLGGGLSLPGGLSCA